MFTSCDSLMFAQDGPQFDILAMATTAMWTKNPKKRDFSKHYNHWFCRRTKWLLTAMHQVVFSGNNLVENEDFPKLK